MIRILFLGFLISSISFSQSDYENIIRRLENLNSRFPEHSEIFELGRNDQNISIKGLKVSFELGENLNHLNRTSHLVVGTHHGNERAAPQLAVKFTENLLEIISSGTSPELTEKTFYIIPVLNISGYNSSNRQENLNQNLSLDSNRDYPDPCAPEKDSFQLRSTSLLADFLETEDIISSVTIHGYVGSFTFPWGTNTSNTHTHDHDTFLDISESAVTHNSYEVGTHADIIYPTIGAYEDWAYWELGVWVALIEMNFFANQDNDSQALLEYFRQVPEQRSNQSTHTGSCEERLRFPFLSRP